MKKRSAEEKYQIVIEMLTTKTPVAEICRKYNVNSAIVYLWKQQFLEAGKNGLRGKKENGQHSLAAENEQLKQLVADLSLANATFKKILTERRRLQ